MPSVSLLAYALTLRDVDVHALVLGEELVDEARRIEPRGVDDDARAHGVELAPALILPVALELDNPALAVLGGVDAHDARAGDDDALAPVECAAREPDADLLWRGLEVVLLGDLALERRNERAAVHYARLGHEQGGAHVRRQVGLHVARLVPREEVGGDHRVVHHRALGLPVQKRRMV